MIRLNGKKIDLNTPVEKASGAEKVILKEIDNISEAYGDSVMFKYLDHLFFNREVVNKNKTGGKIVKRSRPMVFVRARRDVLIDGKRQDIQYYDSVKREPRTGEDIYLPKQLKLEARNTFKKDKIDLIFFLLCVSPNIISDYSPIGNIEKLNTNTTPKYLKLYDESVEARSSMNRLKTISKFDYILTNEIKDDVVRKIALMYGVDNESDIDIVKMKLRKKVAHIDEEKKHVDAYSEFFKDMKRVSNDDDDDVKIRQIIEKAKKDGTLRYEKNKWYLYDGEKNKKELCTRSGSKSKDDVLIERVTFDKDLLSKL